VWTIMTTGSNRPAKHDMLAGGTRVVRRETVT
jgi:hypothetical protein